MPLHPLRLLLSIAAACTFAAPGCFAWVNDKGYTWPEGSEIVMHLQLDHAPASFDDGSASWNGSAADALNTWNTYLGTVRFTGAAPTAQTPGDRISAAFFSDNIYGASFGANVLAVTLVYTDTGSVTSSRISEAEVIVNNRLRWNSYRGPLRRDAAGPIFDFHRVALHEFGHCLGLDHPDERGQLVTALMNSTISDLDALTGDDIEGARVLYGFRITSAVTPLTISLGAAFSYQITANNGPTSFTAGGLPRGLAVDRATGRITGAPSSGGIFDVTLGAFRGATSAFATLRIQVLTPRITSPLATQFLDIGKPFTYTITADNNPTSFDAENLPPGLHLDRATGVISGAPTETTSRTATLIAHGPFSDASGTMSFVVIGPEIVSGQWAPVEVGDPFTYRIAATPAVNPRSYEAEPLPPGLGLDSGTGLISGTPTAIGIYDVRLVVRGTSMDVFGRLRIEVGPPRIGLTPGPPPVLGAPFSMQVWVSKPATAFEAVGLPAGLVIDAHTGLISGTPTLSGLFNTTVTAQTAFGKASGIVPLFVSKPLLRATPVATYRIASSYVQKLIADPKRPRVYFAGSRTIEVVDTETLTSQSIPISTTATDIALSPDGDHLWICSSDKSVVIRIDLNAFTVAPEVPISVYGAQRIVSGLQNRLYVSAFSGPIVQLNGLTGAALAPTGANTRNLQVSVDGRELYAIHSAGGSGRLSRYDISGAAPKLLEESTQYATSELPLLRSTSGDFLVVGVSQPGQIYGALAKVSARDVTQLVGTSPGPGRLGALAINPADTKLFIAGSPSGRIAVHDASTLEFRDSIDTGFEDLTALAVDRSGNYLFVASSGQVRVFRIGNVRIGPAAAPPHALLNVSTRLRSAPGDAVLIGGFIVHGDAPKAIAVRAIGPSLNMPGTLADPTLELYDASGVLVGANDNWNSHRTAVLATGIPPEDEREAMIVATLAPGAYTAAVRGHSGEAGVALVEMYDLAPSQSTIANISTRGVAGTADDVMIGGFIVGGDEPTRVVVRAVGASLAPMIPGALLDTTLALYDANGGLVAQNDNWRADESEVRATGIPPADERESAMVRTLPPGSYTAVVAGKDNTGGVAVVEVYNLHVHSTGL